MKNRLMVAAEAATIKKDVPKFSVGDTVDVHQRILEGAKERVQVFQGVVISRKGEGMSEMFTVRRAKLYYLRERVGKATRLRERKEKEVPGADGAKKRPGRKKKAAAAATEQKAE